MAEVWFSADNLVLVAFQAACMVLVGFGLPAWAVRFRGRWWALALPLSIAVVVASISAFPGTADLLTWVALFGVPIGAALALGWAIPGARPIVGLLAVPLLAVAWAAPDVAVGQLARCALVAGSVITLGRLLAGGVPLGWLKAGVYAMAAIDAYLVFSGSLEAPNNVLVAAAPGGGLPQLQSAGFGSFSIGYGDFFIAAVVGGILAAERRRSIIVATAVAMVAIAMLWDQLFLVYDILPATIPPALALLGAELLSKRPRTTRRIERDGLPLAARPERRARGSAL